MLLVPGHLGDIKVPRSSVSPGSKSGLWEEVGRAGRVVGVTDNGMFLHVTLMGKKNFLENISPRDLLH